MQHQSFIYAIFFICAVSTKYCSPPHHSSTWKNIIINIVGFIQNINFNMCWNRNILGLFYALGSRLQYLPQVKQLHFLLKCRGQHILQNFGSWANKSFWLSHSCPEMKSPLQAALQLLVVHTYTYMYWYQAISKHSTDYTISSMFSSKLLWQYQWLWKHCVDQMVIFKMLTWPHKVFWDFN